MGAWIEAAGPKGKMEPWPEEWRKGRVKRERAGERQNGTELTGHEERGNPCRSLVYNRGIWRSRNADLRIGLVLLHLIKYLTRSRTYVADVVSWIRDVSSTGVFRPSPRLFRLNRTGRIESSFLRNVISNLFSKSRLKIVLHIRYVKRICFRTNNN